jgi:hypothetical protein
VRLQQGFAACETGFRAQFAQQQSWAAHPLWVINGHSAATQQKAAYSITSSAREQRWRNRQAERLGRVEVEDHLDFRGLVHRQIGGLLALEVARIANHFRAPELDRIDLHDRQRTWHRKDPRESEVRLR